jgi:hypothetical protein
MCIGALQKNAQKRRNSVHAKPRDFSVRQGSLAEDAVTLLIDKHPGFVE